jgi:hypothetical protein
MLKPTVLYWQQFPLVRRARSLATVLLLVFVLTGCSGGSNGSTRVAVKGRVTLNGEPLESGLIKFIPTGATKGPVAVVPVKDGVYKCPSSAGPVEGAYRVEIEKGLDEDIAEIAANPKAFVNHLKEFGNPVQDLRIPQKYNRQSELTADVASSGQRTFDFELVAAEDSRR